MERWYSTVAPSGQQGPLGMIESRVGCWKRQVMNSSTFCQSMK